MTFQNKILLAFGIVIIAISASLLLISTKILSQKPVIEEMGKGVSETASTAVPLLKVIGELKLDVVQVQQWLTDISATRGLSGLDDGFDEARKAADKFKVDLGAARKYAKSTGLKNVNQALDHVESKFAPYYATGVKMAQTYVNGGPETGNKMMSSFDQVAEEIGGALEQLIGAIEKETSSDLLNLSNLSADIESGNETIVRFTFLTMLVLLVFIFAVTAYLYLAIRRNFKNLLGDLDVVMAKNMNTPLKINPDGKDEFSAVGRSLVVFRNSLAEIDTLMEREKEQKSSTEAEQYAMMQELASNFDASIGKIVETVSSASIELNATAKSMSGIAEETRSQSAAVSEASKEAASNVHTVAAASEEMSHSIAEINQQVNQASSSAKLAVAEVDKTGTQIETLANTADKISDVISMISDIAEQTNLLALNATIESARAGEAGKGFAVVASEVKGLAGQTAKATEDIIAQVSEIQNATKQAVVSIADIGKIIRQVDETSAAIAAAIEEQGATTQEIARNVQEAARGTEEVNRNIDGVNEASQEAGAASQQVMSAAEDLSRQSEKLRTEVGSFIEKIRAG
jgi:methyl-accepting chemotaxis protein